LDLTFDQTHERRFAGAIAPDQTDTLTALQLQVDAVEQNLLAVMQRNLLQAQQGHRITPEKTFGVAQRDSLHSPGRAFYPLAARSPEKPSCQDDSRNLCMSVRHALAAILLALPLSLTAATSDSSVQERQLFRQTREQLQKNQLTKARPGVAALKNYALAPYLELPLLTARLDELPYDDVENFLQRYPDSLPGDSLRAGWLAELALRQRWQDYLRYYNAETAGK